MFENTASVRQNNVYFLLYFPSQFDLYNINTLSNLDRRQRVLNLIYYLFMDQIISIKLLIVKSSQIKINSIEKEMQRERVKANFLDLTLRIH